MIWSTLRNLFGRVQSLIYRYDCFISYSRRDAALYAEDLRAALQRNGYLCFLDTREMPPGEPLDDSILKALARSSVLVLVVSPKALDSDWVVREVEEFSRFGRPVVPVSMGDNWIAFKENHPFGSVTDRLVWTSDPLERLDTGPSDEVLNGLSSSFRFRKENARRMRILGSVVIALTVLLVLTVFFGVQSDVRRRTAVAERNRAESRRLALEARLSAADPQLAVLLAAAAVEIGLRDDGSTEPTAESQLRQALALVSGTPIVRFGTITAARLDSDLAQVLLGTATGKVLRAKLWGDFSPQLLGTHGGVVSSLGFFDHDEVFSAGLDGKVQLWGGAKGASTLAKDLRLPVKVALDRSRGWLAVGDYEGWVSLGRLASPESLRKIWRFTSPVAALMVSADGRRLFAASQGGAVVTWALREPLQSPVQIEERNGLTLFLSSDSRWLGTGAFDGSVTLYDLERPGEMAFQAIPLGRHRGRAVTGAFSDSGRLVATAGDDLVIQVWRLGADGQFDLWRRLSGPGNDVLTLRFSKDDSELYSVARDGEIRSWRLADFRTDIEPRLLSVGGVESIDLQEPNQAVLFAVNAGIAPDSCNDLLDAGFQGVLVVDESKNQIQVRTGKGADPPIIAPEDVHLEAAYSAGLSSDGKALAVGMRGGETYFWRRAKTGWDGEGVKLLGHSEPVNVTLFTADGGRLITGARDGGICVWDLGSGTKCQELRRHRAAVRAIAVSGDGLRLASADEDGVVLLHDLREGPANDTTREFSTPGPAYAVSLSPDGRWLAAGGQDQTIKIWRISSSGDALGEVDVTQDGGAVVALRFSPDSAWLAAASLNSAAANLWNVVSGQPASTKIIFPATDVLMDVAFSPDGERILMASPSGTLGICERDVGKLLRRAYAAAGRTLTPGERARFFPGSGVVPDNANPVPLFRVE